MNKTFDRYASVVFLVLGVAVYMYSQTLTVSNVGIAIGPSALPSFLSVILIILSAINLIVAIRSKAPDKKGEKLEYKKFLTILVALFLYALLIEPLGYVITTFCFLMVGFQTIEKGQYLKSALIAAVFSIGIYYLYVEIALGVLPPLPILGI